MKNKSLFFSFVFLVIAAGLFSCGKSDSETSVPKANDPSFTEDFDSLGKAVNRGWVIANNSRPIGTIPWVQGFFYLSQHHEYDGKLGATNTYVYDGFGGMAYSYSGTDFAMTTNNCGHRKAVISNWLISPVVEIKNGDIIRFYTRTYSNPAQGADRLQVLINPVNSSADVGRDATSVGNFSQVILDINRDYLLEGDGSYPGTWTSSKDINGGSDLVVTGMPGSVAKKSRIAFRYFVEDGGPSGANSVGIGLDKFEFISVVK